MYSYHHILILYPFRFFQKFLSLFPFHWHYLHAFVDSFQGCYKDGTEPRTFDYRWFSVLLFLLRLILFIIFILTLSMMSFVYAVLALVVILIAILNVQPFKKTAVRYPSNDPIFLVLLSLFFVINIGRDVASRENIFFHYSALIMLTLSAVFPIIYIIYFVSLWLATKIKWIRQLVIRWRRQ